jgi:UbiD family decarboxylase
LSNLRDYLDLLRARGQLAEVTAEVDPRFEVAEIHRRVIARGGPALLFRNVKGAAFPLVTNLFGTAERVAWAFGERPKRFIEEVVHAAETLMPPSLGKLWKLRGLAWRGLKVGMKGVKRAPVLEVEEAPDLGRLPATTSWHSDGGPFLTLPLVLTQHPVSHSPTWASTACRSTRPRPRACTSRSARAEAFISWRPSVGARTCLSRAFSAARPR